MAGQGDGTASPPESGSASANYTPRASSDTPRGYNPPKPPQRTAGGTSRRLGPIRYAHSRKDDAPASSAPADDGAIEGVPVDYVPDDATAGLVYEAPEPETVPPEPAGRGSVTDEGLGIFGGVKTVEVPADDADAPPPARHQRYQLRRTQPPAMNQPAPEPPTATPGFPAATTAGAAWNEPVASPPIASEPADGSKPNPFVMLRGVLRGGGGDPGWDNEPRVSVRDLPPDVQVRFWRIRLTIMLVVGALFGLLLRNWEAALTLAILAGIIDTVYRSRNAHNYKNGSHPGARKRTRRQLNRMRREGYFALDARSIPGSREMIDHLVVGPTGVYAIDSEMWDKKLPILTLNGKRLYLGPESQKERLDHAVWEASSASELLSEALGYEVPVRPALAIFGPRVPWDIATIRNVDVFTGSSLRKYLKRRGRRKDGVVPLTREQVRTIFDTASRVLPDVAPSRNYTPVG
jgi:hypothetical protein